MAELRWGAATHPGLVREENEDAYVAEPLVFGVADGMGGHRAGEVASELASTTLRDRLSAGAPNVDVVVAAVLEANAAIFQAAHQNAGQLGMGTTVTAMAVIAAPEDDPTTEAALVNVGDSRTYLFRNGELTRATVDHSYVQELVSTGHITEYEARTHPRRNIVTRALGIEPTVRVDSWVVPLVRGDRWILCSDGLVDEVPDHEIADVAGGIDDPQRAADELVAMANRHGGRDNTTVVVVDVVDGIDPAALDPTAAPTIAMTSPGDPTDPTALLVAPADEEQETADVTPTVRRMTLGLFLFLFALAAILTLTIVLVALAVGDDGDDPAPSTVVTTTSEPADTTATTEPDETTATTDETVPDTERATTTSAAP